MNYFDVADYTDEYGGMSVVTRKKQAHKSNKKATKAKGKKKGSLGIVTHDQEVVQTAYFESPESSNIHSARYDFETCRLDVTFRRMVPKLLEDGVEMPTYRYEVGPDIWNEFVMAASKGKYFAAAIRSMYAGTRA